MPHTFGAAAAASAAPAAAAAAAGAEGQPSSSSSDALLLSSPWDSLFGGESLTAGREVLVLPKLVSTPEVRLLNDRGS